MAGKGKGKGKGKAVEVNDNMPLTEMSEEQLTERVAKITEELGRIQEEKKNFQLMRDQVKAFWEISKQKLQDVKDKLREGSIVRDEAKMRHRMKVAKYQQKVRHLESECHTNISQLKLDGASFSTINDNKRFEMEQGALNEIRSLQVDLSEKELYSQNHIEQLKFEQASKLVDINVPHDWRTVELEAKHNAKILPMIEASEKKLEAEINILDTQMQIRLESLKKEHDGAFRHALKQSWEFYQAHMEEISLLEKQLTTLMCQGVVRQLSSIQKQPSCPQENLQQDKKKLQELHRQLEKHNEDKAQREASDARLRDLEEELEELSIRHGTLVQDLEGKEQEHQDLFRNQAAGLLDAQHRNGLRTRQLELKLQAAAETLKKLERSLSTAGD
ncbi:dynein regulatory complex subunit 4-like [Syngnathoides biaculeatus]|uniref:dynein regulatory complex subunit 4-like n=1 Tax=Syngnathoides biaculeatus TaxID=300417 RepID=UPI002ADE7E02|nr:dynein regulatory complex subunit 4-like [Syngnathoides biaculeatus]